MAKNLSFYNMAVSYVKLTAVTSFIAHATFFSLSLILSFEEEILVRLKLCSLVTFYGAKKIKLFTAVKIKL